MSTSVSYNMLRLKCWDFRPFLDTETLYVLQSPWSSLVDLTLQLIPQVFNEGSGLFNLGGLETVLAITKALWSPNYFRLDLELFFGSFSCLKM